MRLLQNIKFFLYKRKMKIKREAYIKRLYKEKNVVIDSTTSGFMNVNFEGDNGIPEKCEFLGNEITIGYRTTLGRNNLLSGNIKIGKYCQLGANVALHASNHPISYMSTYINKNMFNGELKNLKKENNITIGNDVWIGHGVIIVGNVTVGNGAILAAGAVITKDVSPYTIVGGIPSKELKKRFSESVMLELEALKWWDLQDEELTKIKPLFFKNFSKANSLYD